MGHFSNDHKDHPNKQENSHKLSNETRLWEFDKKLMETETRT